MTKKQIKSRDLYAEITNKLISAIEAGGELPWNKSWEGAGNISISRNLSTKAAYTGINTLIGLVSMVENGFKEPWRSEEHTSELQSRGHLVCRLLLEKKNT